MTAKRQSSGVGAVIHALRRTKRASNKPDGTLNECVRCESL